MTATPGAAAATRAALAELLAALRPAPLVRTALERHDAAAFASARVELLAVGKAAAGMAAGACAALGARVAGGIIVTPAPVAEPLPDTIVRMLAAHPLPDARSMAAADAVRARLAAPEPDAALLVLLSGGASALLAMPAAPLTLDDVTATNALLLRHAIAIDAVNTVRKHIDTMKGGRLAELAAGRDVLVLAISDVPGDRLDVIGSGPFHPDPTTFGDALAVLRRHGILDAAPGAVRALLERGAAGRVAETPKPGARCFERVRHEVIAGNATACAALAAAIARAGYRARCSDEPVTGEARVAGERLAAAARRQAAASAADGVPRATCAGGETTVHVRGTGRGGRNQELALAAAIGIEGVADVAIASLATDGVDGPTDAAGAIVDGATTALIRAAGIDPHAALANNDAWTALDAAGALVRTGATGTNVADVQMIVSGRAGAR